MRQWLASRDEAELDVRGRQQREQFIALIVASRERLTRLYASDLPRAALLAGKQAEFARLRADYQQLREHQWAGVGRYDGWINAPLNNAKLLPFGLYHQWRPAFEALYELEGRDWPRFHAAVKALAKLDAASRLKQLQHLQAQPTATP